MGFLEIEKLTESHNWMGDQIHIVILNFTSTVSLFEIAMIRVEYKYDHATDSCSLVVKVSK